MSRCATRGPPHRPPPADSLSPQRLGIAATFAVQGLLLTSVTTRLPRFQDRSDLDELFPSSQAPPARGPLPMVLVLILPLATVFRARRV